MARDLLTILPPKLHKKLLAIHPHHPRLRRHAVAILILHQYLTTTECTQLKQQSTSSSTVPPHFRHTVELLQSQFLFFLPIFTSLLSVYGESTAGNTYLPFQTSITTDCISNTDTFPKKKYLRTRFDDLFLTTFILIQSLS